jgi:predicted RNA-binding protein YlxR (DUF448 family)
VVRDPQGTLAVDLRGKVAGRGAYLCAQADCLERGLRESSLSKALERPIDADAAERLRTELAAGMAQRISNGGGR